MTEDQIHKLKFLLAKFQEHLEAENYSPRTLRDYPGKLKPFVEFLKEQDVADVTEVTPEILYKYQMHLLGLRWKGRPLAMATQSGCLVAVRSFFRYLVRRGHLLMDPSSRLEMPRRAHRLPQGIMTGKEIQKVLAQPKTESDLGLRDRAILELLYATGIRNAELRALAVTDVDTNAQEARIRQGKGRRDRVVPLGEIAARYVESYVKTVRADFAAKSGASALFISRNGCGLNAGNLVVLVAKYARRAGLKKRITPHGFRHTCATHMLKRRAGLRHIQALLGHRDLSTTELYTHVTVSDLKREHHRTHPREKTL